MKFHIEIEADQQPGLIDALDEAREALTTGAAWRNISAGSYRLRLTPNDQETQNELWRQKEAAHPKPAAPWRK